MKSNSKPADGTARLVFRIPNELKDQVDGHAADTCRSLNGSLIYLVMRGLAAEKVASGQN